MCKVHDEWDAANVQKENRFLEIPKDAQEVYVLGKEWRGRSAMISIKRKFRELDNPGKRGNVDEVMRVGLKDLGVTHVVHGGTKEEGFIVLATSYEKACSDKVIRRKVNQLLRHAR